MDPPVLDPIIFEEIIKSSNPIMKDFFCNGKIKFANYDSITQGEIGDCWLLAPMCAIARSHNLRLLLERNFEINADRTYNVTLYDNYSPIKININGNLFFLPAQPHYKADLLFAGQQQFLPEKKISFTSIWFAFIEKAAALLRGGYHLLDGGDPGTADEKQADLGFAILTGKKVNTFNIDSIDPKIDFKETIKQLLLDGAAIVYTTKTNSEIQDGRKMKSEPSGTDYSGLNLLEDHAYIIDRINRDGTIKLYNPHGELNNLKHNIAYILSPEDAIFFGKRLDILEYDPSFYGGALLKTKTRKNKKNIKKIFKKKYKSFRKYNNKKYF
jgi:hypothetical protein